ncbi:MAG: DUF3024 domain-containing protein [Candidatus Limnocylindrales bacterium]
MSRPPVLSDLDLAKIRRYIAVRVPDHMAGQIRLELTVRGKSVTIVERRPPWRADVGPEWSSLAVAEFRFDPTGARWTLHWRDHNARWHRYDWIEPSPTIEPLLAELERDPTAIFWG